MHLNFKMVHRVYAQHIFCIAAVFLCLTCFHLVLAKQKETVKKTFVCGDKKKNPSEVQ